MTKIKIEIMDTEEGHIELEQEPKQALATCNKYVEEGRWIYGDYNMMKEGKLQMSDLDGVESIQISEAQIGGA